jgi:hypothetical protein
MEAPTWVSAAIFSVPLLGLAGSAIAFVVKLFQDAKERRHERFFRYMALIDGDAPLVTRLAAVYQLQGFGEHREFLLRYLETFEGSVVGNGLGPDALKTEMRLTAKALKKDRN